MRTAARLTTLCLALSVLAAACAPSSNVPRGPASSAPPRPGVVKRITAAVRGDPPTLTHFTNRATSTFTVPGGLEIQMLVNAALGVLDDRATLRPQLAEQVPSIENGR